MHKIVSFSITITITNMENSIKKTKIETSLNFVLCGDNPATLDHTFVKITFINSQLTQTAKTIV